MGSPRPQRRWFYPRPSWLIYGSLVATGALFLSDRGQWFAFNTHEGWTVLISVAVLGGFLLLTLLWFAAAVIFRRRFQFSLRALMLLAVAVALPFAWLATEMKQAKEQDAIGTWTVANQVLNDYEADASGEWLQTQVRQPPATAWLRSLLGVHFFSDVASITIYSDEDFAKLKALPALRTLSQQENRVTDAGMEHLDKLRRLRRLYLRSTQITDSGFRHISQLTELECLSLGNTRITDAGLINLEGLSHLRWLDLGDLDGPPISDAGLAHLAGLKELTTLILSNARITDTGLRHLAGLSRLEELYINGTPVTAEGLTHLGGLSRLRDLNISGTQVGDSAFEPLARLKSLRRLDLGEHVSDAVVARLKQALPNCEVFGVSYYPTMPIVP